MAAAAVAKARTEALPLVDCVWLRIYCPRCGEWDMALEGETSAIPVEIMACHWCGGHGLALQAIAFGKTTRELPRYCQPQPRRMSDWLKRGDRTKGGRPMKSRAIER